MPSVSLFGLGHSFGAGPSGECSWLHRIEHSATLALDREWELTHRMVVERLAGDRELGVGSRVLVRRLGRTGDGRGTGCRSQHVTI